jgi:regulator of sigma E protease
MLTTLVSFIFVIGVVIFVHELGHFLAAKSVGIRVERFSLGYPPRMVGKKVGDTDYCLSWLPLGGYVKMAGMIDESLDDPEKITGAPDEFMSKRTWQKVLVITAGVIMNFILAWFLYSGVTLWEGIPVVKDPVVATVSPGMPAEGIGLQSGDRILAIDGKPTETWADMVDVIRSSPGKPITITWDHAGERKEAQVVPVRQKTTVGGDIKDVGQIGITARSTFRRAGLWESLSSGVRFTGTNLELGIKSIGMLVTGRASIKEMAGPLAIAKFAGESARGGFVELLLFVAFISINIGLLNILPVPVLDGGHLAMIGIEAVTRRPISVRVKLVVQQVGMVLLFALMAVILWNDAGHIGLFSKIRQMF